MKTLCFVLLSFASFSNRPLSSAQPAKKYYYVCSKPWTPGQAGRQYMMYTDVMEMEERPGTLTSLTQNWRKQVTESCKNEGGCTMDLNYYNTLAEAKAEAERFKNHYRDTTRYIVVKLTYPALN